MQLVKHKVNEEKFLKRIKMHKIKGPLSLFCRRYNRTTRNVRFDANVDSTPSCRMLCNTLGITQHPSCRILSHALIITQHPSCRMLSHSLIITQHPSCRMLSHYLIITQHHHVACYLMLLSSHNTIMSHAI